MAKRSADVTMENVQIRARNFSGKEGQYNPKGQRNFLVLLNDDVAEQMATDGWNIKYFKQREEDDAPQPFLKVKVNFSSEPGPRIVLITSRGKTNLEESDMILLDWADITNVDLIVNPYHYDFNGRQGVTAYLVSAYITISEDELDLKYADLPDSAQSSMLKSEGPDFEEPF